MTLKTCVQFEFTPKKVFLNRGLTVLLRRAQAVEATSMGNLINFQFHGKIIKHIERGDMDQALRLIHKLKRKQNPPVEVIRLLLTEVKIRLLIGDYDLAYELALQALDLSKKHNRLFGIIESKLFLIEYYQEIGDVVNQSQLLKSLMEDVAIYQKTEQNRKLQTLILARVAYQLGKWRLREGNEKEALPYFRDALRLFTNIHHQQGIIETFLAIAKLYLNINELEKAKQVINQALVHATSHENKIMELHTRLLQIELQFKQHSSQDEIEDILNHCEELSRNLPFLRLQTRTWKQIAFVYLELGNEEKALSLLLQAKTGHEQLKEEEEVAQINVALSHIYFSQGQLELSVQTIQNAIETFKKFNDRLNLAKAFYILGMNYAALGKLPQALKAFNQAYQLEREKDNLPQQMEILLSIGDVQVQMGMLSSAQRSYEQAISLAHSVNDPIVQVRAIRALAWIKQLKGELSSALELALQAKAIAEEAEKIHHISLKSQFSRIYQTIGEIYLEQGDPEKAFSYFQLALDHVEPTDLDIKATILHRQIILAAESSDREQIKEYYEELKEVATTDVTQFTTDLLTLARAYILKHSTRGRDKFRAQEIFRQFIHSKQITSAYLFFFAMFNFVELLLFEHQYFPNDEVIEEIEQTVDEIEQRLTVESYSLMAQLHVLKAHVRLLKRDLEGALVLLHEAEELAERSGYEKLSRRISDFLDEILGLSSLHLEGEDTLSLEAMTSYKEEIISRLDALKLEPILNEIITSQFKEEGIIEDEIPILFSLINKSGLILYHHEFQDEKFSRDQLTHFGAVAEYWGALMQNVHKKTIQHINIRLDELLTLSILILPGNGKLIYLYKARSSYQAKQRIKWIFEQLSNDPVIMQMLNQDYVIHDSQIDKKLDEILKNVFSQDSLA